MLESDGVVQDASMKPGNTQHGRRGRVRAPSSAVARRLVTAWLTGCAAIMAALVASADGLSDDELWRYRSSSIVVDAGVVAALPAALETGLAKGFGAGVTVGRALSWGARASWTTATETAIGWTVTHDDVSLRVTGG